MFTRLFYRFRRLTIIPYLAVLPLGVTIEEPDPGELTFGVHGGGGRVLTVIRDCDGNALSTEEHPFTEISGTLQYSRRAGQGDTRWVIGVRGGQVRMADGGATYDYWTPTPRSRSGSSGSALATSVATCPRCSTTKPRTSG
jgi:hypothetical protein